MKGAYWFLLLVVDVDVDLSMAMLILMFLVILLSWTVGLSMGQSTPGFHEFFSLVPGGQAGFDHQYGLPNCVSKFGGGRNLWSNILQQRFIGKSCNFCSTHRLSVFILSIIVSPNIVENRSGMLWDCEVLFRLGKPCEVSYPTCLCSASKPVDPAMFPHLTMYYIISD